MRIAFDMDGTIANLYGVDGWLAMLINHNATAYKQAEVMVNMSALARLLNKLQRKGYEIGVISWLAKNSTTAFDEEVTKAKKEWLAKHLKSVRFDFVEIVPYGTDKNIVRKTSTDILFDDEEGNRKAWGENAYEPADIVRVLKGLTK